MLRYPKGVNLQPSTLTIGNETFSITYAREFPHASDDWYWASLWPSAIALSEHLLQSGSLEGKRVLELGCGCGLAGIVAGQLGGNVTVTDYKEDALQLARENWDRNGMAPAQVQNLDWRAAPTMEPFEIILAADVAYDEAMFGGLIETFGRLLCPGGEIIVAEPGRPQANAFFARLLAAGYKIDTTHHRVFLHETTFAITVSRLY